LRFKLKIKSWLKSRPSSLLLAFRRTVLRQCDLLQIFQPIIKLRYYEKATKFEKISHRFWQNSCFCPVASKQLGDFFKFLWPSQKSWTLTHHGNVYALLYCDWLKKSKKFKFSSYRPTTVRRNNRRKTNGLGLRFILNTKPLGR